MVGHFRQRPEGDNESAARPVDGVPESGAKTLSENIIAGDKHREYGRGGSRRPVNIRSPAIFSGSSSALRQFPAYASKHPVDPVPGP